MVKKIIHTFIYYNLFYHLAFAVLLFWAKDYILSLFCHLTYVKPERVIFYKLNQLTIYFSLFSIWYLIFFSATRNKVYYHITGRDFLYDFKYYHRNYAELVNYFRDGDNMRMDTESLPKMKWQASSGLIFGKTRDKRLISFEPCKNGICAMVWGAPGDGKTTSTIITSCRQFGLKKLPSGQFAQKAAVMVTDLKGDIYEANKQFRRIKRFSTIHWQESAHFDPLTEAREMQANQRAIFLENLAITIIPEDGNAESKYFVDGARDFFTGISLYLLNKDDTIPFPEIVEQIVIGNYKKWVLEIMDSGDKSAMAYTNHFYGENEKNVSGTYSKLVNCARLFSTDIMKILLTNNGDTISPADLENCTDIYIQIDPNQISLLAPLIAMLYQTFMAAVLYRKEGQEPPIAFIMDEFGQIPAMPVIAQSAALMRAYNCSLLFSCQSLAMIEKHYGSAGRKLLMDCVKVHCFLSIMDPDTREWASKLIGTKKVLKISNSEQGNGFSGRSVTEARERVFEPEEFGDLPNKDELIIYYKGKYIKAKKAYYFK